MPPEAVAGAIQQIRATTSKPFGVNFITQFAVPEHVDAAIAGRPSVVSFHWNDLPVALIERVKRADIPVWVQVGTVAMAKDAAALGVDAIIAQGSEAGGHVRGEAATMVLLPAVIDAVGPKVPVIAAGGIADGRGMAAALAMGADAVWVGTRLLASDEATAHSEYKRRVVAAGPGDTMVTTLFGPEWPDRERVLINRVVREWGHRVGEIPAELRSAPSIGKTMMGPQPYEMPKFSVFLPIPETTGDFEEMNMVAGESSGLIHDIQPAARIVQTMADQAETTIHKLQGLLR
jgi:NAD(P)H-dependent flavin oxidoreductase YrpB (nitropropane dioxygenase family)